MTETARTTIANTPEALWALIGDFGGLDTWMAGVDSCVVNGDVRTVETMGMTIEERLVSRDDSTRAITYSIVGEASPVKAHEATIRVGDVAEDGSTEITWDVTVEPAEAEAMFRDIYQGALDAFKASSENG